MSAPAPTLRARSRSRRRKVRWGSVVSAGLLTCVCAVAFFLVVLPLLLGAQSFTVLTGSMRPALEPGHLIAVRATPIDRIMVGDVVTYQLRSGEPEVVTHRVVGVGTDGDGERVLVTRGDANDVVDPEPVRAVQVRGVMLYGLPALGFVNIWATPAIKSTVVTALGVAAIGWGATVLVRDRRAHRPAQIVSSSAAALAVAMITLTPFTPPSAAAADDPLELSADGITWTSDPTLTLVDASERLVPGIEVPVPLWIRNTTDDDAEFTVSSRWQAVDDGDPADIALASALAAPEMSTRSLDGGDSVRLELPLALPGSAGNETRQGWAELEVTVTMTEIVAPEPPAAPPPGQDPDVLGSTGIAAMSGGLAIGIALIALGAALRQRRSIRRHPPRSISTSAAED